MVYLTFTCSFTLWLFWQIRSSDYAQSSSHEFALMIAALGAIGVDGLAEQVTSRSWWGVGYLAVLIMGSILIYAVLTLDFAFRLRSKVLNQIDKQANPETCSAFGVLAPCSVGKRRSGNIKVRPWNTF